MAHQGCPDEGKDTRLFGRWGCWVQSRLSFHTQMPPIQLILRFPFYVAFLLPLYGTHPQKWFNVRIGFRWDTNWHYDDGSVEKGGYLFPEFIIKVLDHVVY